MIIVVRLFTLSVFFVFSLIVVCVRRWIMGNLRQQWDFATDAIVQFMQVHRLIGLKVERLRRVNQLTHLLPPKKGITIEKKTIKTTYGTEVYGEWLIPTDLHDDNKVILYFHGGAFIFCSTSTHRDLICNIAVKSRTKVFAFNYRLAPEHKYPSQVDDGMSVYNFLCNTIPSKNIIFAGDSAGGNLALSVALHLRDAEKSLPKGIALMSPWLDLTTSSPSWLKNFDHDFLPEPSRMYTLARYYTPDHMRLADPRISPIFADLSGLPPIFVQVSTTEQVYDDTAWLEAKAKSHNVEITVDAFKNLPHVFQAFRIPQAQQAFENLGAWVLKQHERENQGDDKISVSESNIYTHSM